jgi:hypothetical protein
MVVLRGDRRREEWMPRLAGLVAVLLVAGGGAALAQEAGRYQIVTVPLNVAGELQSSTVLLDTATGRTWQAVLDDKGRPRWRGIEFAGGSQSVAELPPAPQPTPQSPGQPENASGTEP